MRANTVIYKTRNRTGYLTPLLDGKKISVTITNNDTELTGVISIRELLHLLNKNMVRKEAEDGVSKES